MEIEYTAYVDGDSGREHEIVIEVSFTVTKDGIGSYEFWGERGWQEEPCLDDVEVLGAYLVSQSGKSCRRIKSSSVWADIARERFEDDYDAWCDYEDD